MITLPNLDSDPGLDGVPQDKVKTVDSELAPLPGYNVFHSHEWMELLQRVYRHQSLKLVETDRSGRINAAAAMALVRSPLTGRRLVSLPFSDAAPFLFQDPENFESLLAKAVAIGRQKRCRFVEIRGQVPAKWAAPAHAEFFAHFVDLSGGAEEVWSRCSESTRRAVRKAEKAGFETRFFHDRSSIIEYYRLHCMTRQRQGVPPQSLAFFLMIGEILISAAKGFVALLVPRNCSNVAGRAVAGAVFLRHCKNAIYKYSASDSRYAGARPNNLLLWDSIKRLIELGDSGLDFGRTEKSAIGLRRYKMGWGPTESDLRYHRFDIIKNRFVAGSKNRIGVARLPGWVPLPVLRMIGRSLYPHLH